MNILGHLGMISTPIPTIRSMSSSSVCSLPGIPTSPTIKPELQPYPPIICSKGFWTYTTTGGVLEVYPTVNSFVKKGMVVARIKNIFGNVVDNYFAPCDAMVIF